jgi:hypothetical protein
MHHGAITIMVLPCSTIQTGQELRGIHRAVCTHRGAREPRGLHSTFLSRMAVRRAGVSAALCTTFTPHCATERASLCSGYAMIRYHYRAAHGRLFAWRDAPDRLVFSHSSYRRTLSKYAVCLAFLAFRDLTESISTSAQSAPSNHRQGTQLVPSAPNHCAQASLAIYRLSSDLSAISSTPVLAISRIRRVGYIGCGVSAGRSDGSDTCLPS